MTLEVNVDPPNHGSLAFHASRGYAEVGRLGEPGHVVGLMVKELDGARRGADERPGPDAYPG